MKKIKIAALVLPIFKTNRTLMRNRYFHIFPLPTWSVWLYQCHVSLLARIEKRNYLFHMKKKYQYSVYKYNFRFPLSLPQPQINWKSSFIP